MARTAETKRLCWDPGFLFVILLALGAVFLGVVGYQLGFLGFVYKLMMPQTFSSLPVYALAAVMGVAAFFSPCAFPLLPGYMTYQLEAQHGEAKLLRSVYLGLLGALGVILVNMALGVVIASLGAAAPFNPDPRQAPWVILAPRLLGGLFVVYVGVLYLINHSLKLGPIARLGGAAAVLERPKGSPGRNTFLYGLLYNVIGVGCTGALLLALMLYAFTIGGFWTALLAFIVFSGTMGFLMLPMTILVGLSRATLVRRLRTIIPVIRKVSGAIMLVVGALTVAFVLQGNQLFTKIFLPLFSVYQV